MEDDQNDVDQNKDDIAVLIFDVDDVAIERAAAGAGTIPTGSINILPPNCC